MKRRSACIALLACALAAPPVAAAVRQAKPAEIRAAYAAVDRPARSGDVPPDDAVANVGSRVRASAWRRVSGAQPASRGDLLGVWIAVRKSSLCYAILTRDERSLGGCPTLNVRTPREPFPPITVSTKVETITDPTAPVGIRDQDSLVVIVPDGPTRLKVSEKGGAVVRNVSIRRNTATLRVLAPYCLSYRIAGDTQQIGRDCGAP